MCFSATVVCKFSAEHNKPLYNGSHAQQSMTYYFNPLDSDGKFRDNISVLSGGAGNVDSLFQSLDHVSRAVGTLVNIMTDDEAADSQSVPPTSARVGQSRAPYQ